MRLAPNFVTLSARPGCFKTTCFKTTLVLKQPEACCATCDSFTCPDGYVQKSNAASIFGELRDLWPGLRIIGWDVKPLY